MNFSGTGHIGLTLNNLTTTQINALTPSKGMLAYNTSFDKLFYYDGTLFRQILNTYDASNTYLPLLGGTMSGTLALGTQQLTFGGNLLADGATGYTFVKSQTHASSSDTGVQSAISWDANYLYICVAANTWRRIAHSSY